MAVCERLGGRLRGKQGDREAGGEARGERVEGKEAGKAEGERLLKSAYQTPTTGRVNDF